MEIPYSTSVVEAVSAAGLTSEDFVPTTATARTWGTLELRRALD